MDVSSFSKERILITLKQSYNFDKDIVEAAKQVALEKGYMSSFEIDRLLEKNEEIREERKEILDAEDKETLDLLTNKEKSSKTKRIVLNWISVFVGIVCFYLWSITGIGWFLIIPLISFFTAKTVSNRYFKRTINK